MDDMKKVGSVGLKTVLYFMCTTAVACVIGLVFANIFMGAGLLPDLSAELGAAEYEPKAFNGFMSVLVDIFPSNMWGAFVNANMLQVIVVSLFFGGSIMAAGEKARLVQDIVSAFYAVIEKLMGFIISLSPIGVFTYMAWVVATEGPEIVGNLAIVILCAYAGYFIHAALVYSLSAQFLAGMSPLAFFKGAFAAMMFAFTSTSSAATLPVSKECAKELDADEDADGEARQAHHRVQIAAADADDHPQGAPQKHQRPDHHEHRHDKADQWRRAPLGLELAPEEGDGRGPQHQADDLRTDVLDDAGAHLRVEPGPLEVQRPRDVPQEAGDAEAHVRRVPPERQGHRRRAHHQARGDDEPVAFGEVFTLHVSFLLSLFAKFWTVSQPPVPPIEAKPFPSAPIYK